MSNKIVNDTLIIGSQSLKRFNEYCSPGCVLDHIVLDNTADYEEIKDMIEKVNSFSPRNYLLLDLESEFQVINGVMKHNLGSHTLKLLDYRDLPSTVSVRCVYTNQGESITTKVVSTELDAFVATIFLMNKPEIKLYVERK